MIRPKFYILSVFLALSMHYTSHLSAQNLIPNPSFEETNAAVRKLKHEMRNFGIMSDWKALTNSPDAHHPVVSDVKFDHRAPNFLNQFGEQLPRTGEGKIGMYVAGNSSKETIIARLLQPLKANTYYYFHMYVSLGEGLSNSCTSSIGFLFYCNRTENDRNL